MTFELYQRSEPVSASEHKVRRSHVHNMMLDAITPRRRGGKYTLDNCAQLCKGCNLVKAGFYQDEALVLINALRAGKYRLEDGFMRPQDPLPHSELDSDDERLIDAWAAARLTCKAPWTRRKEDLVEMLKEVYVSPGRYLDPTGVVLPITLAEVDKLDPSKGYQRSNIRALLGGLNWLKSTSNHDHGLETWLQGLKESAVSAKVQTLLAAGVKILGESWSTSNLQRAVRNSDAIPDEDEGADPSVFTTRSRDEEDNAEVETELNSDTELEDFQDGSPDEDEWESQTEEEE